MTKWVEVLDHAFAELGLSENEIRAIYRNNERVITNRKDHHWGKRKLKRDQ